MSQAAKENSLDLSNNSIGDDGAKALAEMLKVNKSLGMAYTFQQFYRIVGKIKTC